MHYRQRTIAKAVSCSGIGVHSGRNVNLTIKPAPVNHGIKFIRTDLPDKPAVSALFNQVVDHSPHALAGVEDLPRVFRQVHRVLRPEMPFVFSLPHPAYSMIDPRSEEPLRVRRAYWDSTPRPWSTGDREGTDHSHTVADLLLGLARTNFRVDTLLEPPVQHDVPSPFWSETMTLVPATLVIRGRKEGI